MNNTASPPLNGNSSFVSKQPRFSLSPYSFPSSSLLSISNAYPSEQEYSSSPAVLEVSAFTTEEFEVPDSSRTFSDAATTPRSPIASTALRLRGLRHLLRGREEAGSQVSVAVKLSIVRRRHQRNEKEAEFIASLLQSEP
nr:hypothetical protein Iba_chr09fCG2330 [Ipomoea batatas]